MLTTKQRQVSMDRYRIIMSRYHEFIDNCDDVSKKPVRVFDGLSQKSLDELHLIREVSKELQIKKDEDLKKAELAAEAAREAAEAKEAEAKEAEAKAAEAKATEAAAEESEVPKEKEN